MAEGFKALKLEDDGVPVETVSGNGVSRPQVQFCGSRFIYFFFLFLVEEQLLWIGIR
jgi:hypothetical protein